MTERVKCTCGVYMQKPMYAMRTVIKVSRQVGSCTCSVNFTLPVAMFCLYSGFFGWLERGGFLTPVDNHHPVYLLLDII